MSEPTEGWPWVEAGVPAAIERLHPGFAIGPYSRFAVPRLRLFVVRGGRRRETAPERFASVEAVDESGAVLAGRALFVRAAIGVTDARELAAHAMAFLLRRADESPLVPATAGPIVEWVRPAVAAPHVDDHALRFWVRAASDSPYAAEVTVDLATGAYSGDSW